MAGPAWPLRVREDLTWITWAQPYLPSAQRQCPGTASADSPRARTEAFLKHRMESLSSGKMGRFLSICILSDPDQLFVPQPGSMGKPSTKGWGSPQHPQLQQLTWNHTREEESLPATGSVPKLFFGLTPHVQELSAPGSFFMGYRFHCNGRIPCLMSSATANSVRIFIKGAFDPSRTTHSISSPTTYFCVFAGNASNTDKQFLNFLTSHSLQC